MASRYMKGDAKKWITLLLEKYIDTSIKDAKNTKTIES